MKRLAQTDLFNWFNLRNRKPLILRGARQVGKSTLVRQFCQEYKLDLVEINFEERPLKSLQNEGYPLDDVLKELEFRTQKKLDPKSSVIFFDEIQEQPKAINLLRYFYEKRKELAVIAAGSLLEVTLKHKEIDFPVGRVDFYELGPMTFEEYIMGIADNSEELLAIQNSSPIPLFMHEQLINRLKEFYIVGGMPEAVRTYKETKSFYEVRRIQNQLIETYQSDFFKYANKMNIPKLTKIFDYVPCHLGKKVKYVEISRDFKSRELSTAIQLLSDAKVITPVYYSKGQRVPLKSEIDSSVYKLFFIDIGLCSKINNVSLETYDSEKFSIYLKGELAEQFVFQHLHYGSGKFESRPLYYWLNEKKNSEAELDFIIEENGQILPIEVKAQNSSKLKSLIYFMYKGGHQKAFKISVGPFLEEKVSTTIFNGEKNVQVEFDLYNVPLYSIGTTFKTSMSI